MKSATKKQLNKITVHHSFHLGNGVYLQRIRFKGKKKIDIRQWAQNGCGPQMRPTHKGIRLTINSWKNLLLQFEYIMSDLFAVLKKKAVISDYHYIGCGIFASMQYAQRVVDVREWHGRKMTRRSWKGIHLTFPQMLRLLDLTLHVNIS